MSAFSDFMTEPTLWWGAAAGALGGAGITAAVNSWTVNRSDTRNFGHEDDLDQRKADREQKQRNEEIVFEASTTFAAECSDILMNAIDTKGIFNFMRDAFHNKQGTPDAKAMEKFMFAEDQTEQMKRIATPFNKLKMVAPVELLQHASRLNAALLTVFRTTTESIAKPVAMKAAGDELACVYKCVPP